MGANGSFLWSVAKWQKDRSWKTVREVEGIKVIKYLKSEKQLKMPVESRTPNRKYAIMKKDGSDIKEISGYGPDGKKQWSIHTDDHYGIKPHWHKWENGTPIKGSERALTDQERKLLEIIRKSRKNK